MLSADPPSPRHRRLLLVAILLPVMVGGLYLAYRVTRGIASSLIHGPSNSALDRWFSDSASRAELFSSFDAPCPGYPFLVPSSGLVGGLPYNATYGPYNIFNPHSGIDIFGEGALGTVPIRAAYDGFLTREADWISAVIIRHDDPLNPGQTIWTYYTHMANLSGTESYILPEFPRGTYDAPVRQGDLIGYQGIYNGGMNASTVAMHLHFSVVRSNDDGSYRNETNFENTLDPTPYLGLLLNNPDSSDFPLRCLPPPT